MQQTKTVLKKGVPIVPKKSWSVLCLSNAENALQIVVTKKNVRSFIDMKGTWVIAINSIALLPIISGRQTNYSFLVRRAAIM